MLKSAVLPPLWPVAGRAAVVAIFLGAVLTTVNQPGAVFGSENFNRLSMTLVFVTPFLVVSASQILGIRAARRTPAWTADARERFFRTLISHGIPARSVILGLAAGTINTAIVATQSILAGQGLDQLPVALILQALTLPIVFGALSQTLSFRRAVAPGKFQPQPQLYL